LLPIRQLSGASSILGDCIGDYPPNWFQIIPPITNKRAFALSIV
jgi:hypothetical protein